MDIILASNSPRRKEILTRANINFKVKTSDCREEYSKIYDEKIVLENSLKKALAAKEGINGPSIIIGADTVVILDSVCLVKPHNKYEAFFILKKLSNRTHSVVTSHTVLRADTNKILTKISTSYVTFRCLGILEIIKYINDFNPLDKAGSYGIQDFIKPDEINNINKKSFIKELKGSYYNVMGLDVELVKSMIDEITNN